MTATMINAKDEQPESKELCLRQCSERARILTFLIEGFVGPAVLYIDNRGYTGSDDDLLDV